MEQKRVSKKENKKAAVIVSVVLFVLASASLLYLLFPYFQGEGSKASGDYVAEIYQDGRLLYRIPLREIHENRTLVIEGGDGCRNEIEIRPDGVGVISADCPDKLCVRQGFINNDRLPVVCLPNRLVIRLCLGSQKSSHNLTNVDGITY